MSLFVLFSSCGCPPCDRNEKALKSSISVEILDGHLEKLSSSPRLSGTEGASVGAEYIKSALSEYGLDVHTYRHSAGLSYPGDIGLKKLSPREFDVSFEEKVVKEDPYTVNHHVIKPYLAYSGSARTRGGIVYANFCTSGDLEKLKKLGYDPAGKILLARLGRIYRGSKAYLAEKAGAAGLILYPDRAEEGFFLGRYPKGPMRPESAIERGTLRYFFLSPLDGGTPDIPVVSISLKEGKKLIQSMGGRSVPEEWKGMFDTEYRLGAEEDVVLLESSLSSKRKTITNIIGVIRGSRFPEEKIVLGGHYDSWGYGAADGAGGIAVLLELARIFSSMASESGVPERTLMFCCWDAEEFGLLGSSSLVTEELELFNGTVAYINLGTAVCGHHFTGYCDPELEELLYGVKKAADDPIEGKTVYEVSGTFKRPSFSSDQTPFITKLGVPSAVFRYGTNFGVYHTLYDNYNWMKTQIDPDTEYLRAMTEIAGITLLRLSRPSVVPYDLKLFAEELKDDFGIFLEKHPIPEVPDKSIIEEIYKELDRSINLGRQFTEVRSDFRAGCELLGDINSSILSLKKNFIAPEGLPGREWYGNMLYCPDPETGYGRKHFPFIENALAEGDAGPALDTFRRSLLEYNDELEAILKMMRENT